MSTIDHVVVVTGASVGIGAATARAFARNPGTAVALVSRDRAKLEETAAACRSEGATADVFPCDLTDRAEVADMAAAVAERYAVPTAVVNNAGVFAPGGVAETDAEAFAAQVETNLMTAYHVTRAFLPDMIERGSGHFFFTGSVASIRGYPRGAAYCASKHALLGLARALREETKENGIRVTTLLPGATLTPSWEGSGFPDDRFMPAADVAEAIVGAYRMSGRSVVEEILIRPQLGDI